MIHRAEKLLDLYSNSTILNSLCGASYAALKHFDKAIEAYLKVVKISPNYAEAHSHLAQIYVELADYAKAAYYYKKALLYRPALAEAIYGLATCKMSLRQFESAIDDFLSFLKLRPDQLDALYNLAGCRREILNLEGAIVNYEQVLKIDPNYVPALNDLGIVMRLNGQANEAVQFYRRALDIRPNSASIYHNLGNAQREMGDASAAIDNYRKALEINPKHASSHLDLALSKSFLDEDTQLKDMKDILNNGTINDEDRIKISYAISKAYDDLRDFDRSFKFLSESKDLKKTSLEYYIDADKEHFRELIKSFNNYSDFALDSSQTTNQVQPIFIVGMPRSGTTLTEQIISAHSNVSGAGELPYVTLFGGPIATGLKPATRCSVKKFRQNYLEQLECRSFGAQLVTDKFPLNFKYIGLICSAFPNAKIINVKRDPIATCWSIYRTYFAGDGLGFANNMNDIGDFYRLYREIMWFWNSKFKKNIFELDYEGLTQNPERGIGELLSFLELDWEKACFAPEKNTRPISTASLLQVREKIYRSSSQAWRNYASHIGNSFGRIDN